MGIAGHERSAGEGPAGGDELDLIGEARAPVEHAPETGQNAWVVDLAVRGVEEHQFG
jgi:hypothetical protein